MAAAFVGGAGFGAAPAKVSGGYPTPRPPRWAAHRQTAAVRPGGRYTSLLANEKEYASYVNDGHRMDRHFVPGLYIDSRGLLSRDLSRNVGLTVGTKTGYVPGLHMKEQAVQAYEDAAASGLEALGKEIFL